MNRRTLLAVLLVATVAVGGAGVASAAGNNSTTATPVADGGHPVAVDGVLSVTGWEYEDGRMNVTLRASQYKSVTLAASAEANGRVAQAAYRQVVLQRGDTTTVSLPADRVDGAASVSVTTGACIASGSCPTIYSDDNTGPWLTGGSEVGWLGGAGVALASCFGIGWWTLRRGTEEPEVA
ncbi:hypothetical protein [Halarchaeum grantii]|uniref:hypothetical protein n=1 Tax=Halarchaeum grantii TaxID=1193105 RepID=UPI001669B5E6|nr:hypothetical protein [Halarchaeum grantii]